MTKTSAILHEADITAATVSKALDILKTEILPVLLKNPALKNYWEWLNDARVHLRRLNEAFARNEWPQNDSTCGMYGGCRFRPVCGASPAEREDLLGKL